MIRRASVEGQGLVEYALIMLLVALAVIGLLGTLGVNLNGYLSGVATELAR